MESTPPPFPVAEGEVQIAANGRLLVELGLVLASGLDLDISLQCVVDTGRALCQAAVGKLWRTEESPGSSIALQSPVEAAPALLASLPSPVDLGWKPGQSTSVLRFDDLSSQSAFAPWQQANGLSTGAWPLRSYLACRVCSRQGKLLGFVAFGHPAEQVFAPGTEDLLQVVAAQAGLLLEEARLQQALEAVEQAAKHAEKATKRAEAAAQSARHEERISHNRLVQALETNSLGTWSWNAHTDMLDFDERGALFFGVTPHTPVKRSRLRHKVVKPDDLGAVPADLRDTLRTGGRYAAEFRVQTAGESIRWLSTRGNATLDPSSGEMLGMVGTVQDITERKAQEAALRTSEKLAATGRLAATIAHEINNPLEAVTNLIYLAKTDPEAPPAVARLLETADTELARVAQIAQQTLGFYRDTTRPVTVDLNDLLGAVVNLFSRKLQGKRLHCTLDLEPGLSVMGLQGEIRQIVSNLLVNAIDATDTADTRIHIRARRRRRGGHSGVSMLISDRGAGIPTHVRSRLFTPFFTTKSARGTGLGLWVTLGMVEKHGGSVRFRTKTEHPSGTVFQVFLPAGGSPQLFTSTSPILQ